MTVGDFVNVNEAAEIIGCTDGRVRQLLNGGAISGAIKANERAWLIPRIEAERVRDIEHGTGRPRKLNAANNSD